MKNSIFNLSRVKSSVAGGFYLALLIVGILMITHVRNASGSAQSKAAPAKQNISHQTLLRQEKGNLMNLYAVPNTDKQAALRNAAESPTTQDPNLSTIEAQIRDAYLRQEEVVLNDAGTSNVPGLNLSSIDAQISDLHLQEEEAFLNAAQMSTFQGFSVTLSSSQ